MIDYVGNNYQSRGLSNLLHIDRQAFSGNHRDNNTWIIDNL